MAERIMAEVTSGPGVEGISSAGVGQTGSVNIESQPQRPWHFEPEFDPNRIDYVVKVEGNYHVSYDPNTGKEVARVLQVAGGADDEKTSPTPEDALADLLAKALTSPAFEHLLEQRVAQRMQEALGRQREISQAIQTPEAIARWSNSVFGRLMTRIEDLQTKDTLDQSEQTELINTIEKRDELVEDVNILSLLNLPKMELFGMYYDARVKTTLKEKEGKEEYRERGKLDELEDHRGDVNERFWESGAIAPRRSIAQIKHRVNPFWSKISIREVAQRFESIADVGTKQRILNNLGIADVKALDLNKLQATYAGSIDYFYRESMNMIISVVEDPDAFRDPKRPYSSNWVNQDKNNGKGLFSIWNGIDIVTKPGEQINNVVVDERGRPSLTDADGNLRMAIDWDDIRDAVEEERAADAYVSSRDYETWIQFVADNGKEIRRHIPDIARKVIRKLGGGEAQALYQNLDQEERKIETALAYFKFPEKERRAVRSTLINEIAALGAYEFSKKVREDAGPYFMFAKRLATACEDTERQDHFVDSTILDDKGENLVALSLYSGDLPSTSELEQLVPAVLRDELKDWGFWRYGKNHRFTHKMINEKGEISQHDMAALYRKQRRYRKTFEDIMMAIKLKPIAELLNLDDKGVFKGEPTHPAFQRLKEKLEDLDEKERAANNRQILDADGNPTSETRWQEYCRKALVWENGKIDDLRESPRVIFQHPLARALRPKGFKDEGGNVTNESEFWSMFKLEDRREKWYLRAKKRRIQEIAGREKRAERLLTVFQMDATAGLARHTLDDVKEVNGKWESKYGDVILENGKPAFLQITDELRFPITFGTKTFYTKDNGYVVEDIVPHFVLIRALAHQALKEDAEEAEKSGEDRRFFKAFNIIKQAGIPIDSPQFAAWAEGSDDTIRPVLMKYTGEIEIFKEIFKKAEERLGKMLVDGRPDRDGADEKNLMSRYPEKGRRFLLALKYAVRKKWGKYYNFSGHNTKYGGTKEIKNANEPNLGISSYTVDMTEFIEELIGLEGDFASDYGCTENPWVQLIGMWKCADEVAFAESGYLGYIAGPRDPESWVKRAQGNFAINDLLTKGDKNNPASHGILNDGILSGAYHLRVINVSANFGNMSKNYGIDQPKAAYDLIDEPGYERYIDTVARVAAPFLSLIHQIYNSEDSNFGRNPESAKFVATMLWYSLSSWMDHAWAEYRGIYGFAYDATLPLARVFMHTLLKELALIYTDQQWDEIMLGYSRAEYEDGTVERIIRYKVDQAGNTVERLIDENKKAESDGDTIKVGVNRRKGAGVSAGKQIKSVDIEKGILDAFPKKLREEIIRINNDHTDINVKKWLPVGINSYRSETLAIMKDFKNLEGSARTQNLYKIIAENLDNYTQPRREIIRTA